MRPGGEQSGLVRGPGRLRAAITTPFVRALTMHGLPSPSSLHSEVDTVSYSLKTTRPEAPLCLHGYIPSYQYQPPPVYPNTVPITALPAIRIGNTELLLCSRYPSHHHSPALPAVLIISPRCTNLMPLLQISCNPLGPGFSSPSPSYCSFPYCLSEKPPARVSAIRDSLTKVPEAPPPTPTMWLHQ